MLAFRQRKAYTGKCHIPVRQLSREFTSPSNVPNYAEFLLTAQLRCPKLKSITEILLNWMNMHVGKQAM